MRPLLVRSNWGRTAFFSALRGFEDTGYDVCVRGFLNRASPVSGSGGRRVVGACSRGRGRDQGLWGVRVGLGWRCQVWAPVVVLEANYGGVCGGRRGWASA